MDGITQRLAVQSGRAPVIGILYAEDFDDVANQTAADAQPAPDDLSPPLTEDDLDRACNAAVATARLQWQNETEQLRANLLGQISAALNTARDTATEIASTAAEAAAQAVLAMLSGALPHFCNEHGPAEARAIVDHLLPMLRSEPRVVVRVHPDLAPELRREFVDLQVDFSGTLTVLPTAVEPGDVKIEWENGTLSRDTRQILQAMQDALGQLGLQQPRETTPTRRMAHAE